MATFGGHLVSSVDMIAIIAHTTGIMLSVDVLAVRHHLSSPTSLGLSGIINDLDFSLSILLRFFFGLGDEGSIDIYIHISISM